MKRHIFKYLLILVSMVTIGLSSCSDYLEETDPNLLSSETYWRNLNDTKSGLTATYASLLNHYVLNIPEESCRADMGWPGYGRPSPNGGGPVNWYYHTYSSTTTEVERKWQALYLGVFRANQVIEGLEIIKADMTEDNMDEWTNQMGEARFFRGLFHFYLYQTYNNGSIVIREDVPLDLTDFNKSLSTAEEAIEFVREDLLYAYTNLVPRYTEAKDQGRITAGAAATILGNTYLFEGEYDAAKPYFEDVINNDEYGYELVQDLDLMFTQAGELNAESILEICYNVEYRTELSSWDEESLWSRWASRTAGNTGCLTPVWLAYAYKSEDMDPLDSRNYYEDESNPGVSVLRNVPLRASAMVTLVEDEQTAYYGGTVTENTNYTWNGWGFSRPKKYTNHDHLTEEAESGGSSNNSEKNVTIDRLAEVYLNLAECILKTDGDVQDAIDLINDIRSRWGLVLLGNANGDASHTYNGLAYTADELMDQIMFVEKPLELSNEGHEIRWVDMRRWGITAEVFEKLSNEVYYAIDYSFVSTNGTNKTLSRASLVKSVPPGYSGKTAIVDYEYDQSVLNYNPAVHDYFGIPSNETISNSNVN
ncbi:RagB/SusD family nutrient uptake outer membrane protein [Labilibaculum antarcticum]|uniref:RagB/SusD family nutrient uptake outer membrane protein n=1 Tax=Labilibaculum antarcticum TaxID=1717717 RepID=A0A1Y1CL62_9BACT|nr:RagB/SusD family nutrient uptake outer membrane protein [Labilibaculum antarcticum]BAX81107.1 RagB/SusD family nutrient uptake outer membrane protein [Labilibaculum antarcticum]